MTVQGKAFSTGRRSTRARKHKLLKAQAQNCYFYFILLRKTNYIAESMSSGQEHASHSYSRRNLKVIARGMNIVKDEVLG